MIFKAKLFQNSILCRAFIFEQELWFIEFNFIKIVNGTSSTRFNRHFLSSNSRLLAKLIFLSVYFYGAHGGAPRAIMALVLTLMLLVFFLVAGSVCLGIMYFDKQNKENQIKQEELKLANAPTAPPPMIYQNQRKIEFYRLVHGKSFFQK